MAKVMSYVAVLDAVLNGEPIEGEVRERLEALREAQVKRNAAKSSANAKGQKERSEAAEKLYEAMEPGVVYSFDDIAELLPDIKTPQRLRPLIVALGDKIVVGKAKGKNTYSLADEGVEE